MKKIVITGAPGSGKTIITAHLAAERADRFALVPEAATQVYALLQTRWDKLDMVGRRSAQRQMYQLQLDQEQRIAAAYPGKILLLDRGTVDGAAYWPDGADEFWPAVATSKPAELARYDAVILLETCATLGLYDGDVSNFCRFEDPAAAIRSSDALKELWRDHPRLRYVDAFATLDEKINAVRRVLNELTSAETAA